MEAAGFEPELLCALSSRSPGGVDSSYCRGEILEALTLRLITRTGSKVPTCDTPQRTWYHFVTTLIVAPFLHIKKAGDPTVPDIRVGTQ